MNFLPIFKYRLKDDLKAVGVFLLVTLLCIFQDCSRFACCNGI